MCALVPPIVPSGLAAQERLTTDQLYTRYFNVYRTLPRDCRQGRIEDYAQALTHLFAYVQVAGGRLDQHRSFANQLDGALRYLEGVVADPAYCVASSTQSKCDGGACSTGVAVIPLPEMPEATPRLRSLLPAPTLPLQEIARFRFDLSAPAVQPFGRADMFGARGSPSGRYGRRMRVPPSDPWPIFPGGEGFEFFDVGQTREAQCLLSKVAYEAGERALYIDGVYEGGFTMIHRPSGGTPYNTKSVTCQAPSLNYRQFSVALRFKPLSIFDGMPFLVGGDGHRWIKLIHYDRTGTNVCFDGCFRVPVSFPVGEWSTAALAVDLDNGTLDVYVNGELVLTHEIALTFRLGVAQDDNVHEKEFSWVDYSVGRMFHGFVSELVVFNRPLTPDEMRAFAFAR